MPTAKSIAGIPAKDSGLAAGGRSNSLKLSKSRADYWVLVLQGFYNASVDYVVIPPQELLRRLQGIHRGDHKIWQVYLWVTKKEQCWETRGLIEEDKLLIACGKFSNPNRNFKKYLHAWGPIERLNQSRRKAE